MKALLPITLLVTLLFSTLQCQPVEVRKGMAQFDQAFLPVLLYAYAGDMHQAKRAIFYLEFRWQRLQDQSSYYTNKDKDWRETFERINQWLGDAYYAIDANCQDIALAELEHVRYELLTLRERQHLDYYLDYLYNFQYSTDVLRETAGDEMLCLLEWGDLEQQAATMNTYWQQVLAQTVDADMFELDAQKLGLLQQRLRDMSHIMAQINTALDAADRRLVEAACEKIEPTFLDILRVFGNFNASATYFAKNNAATQQPERYYSVHQN